MALKLLPNTNFRKTHMQEKSTHANEKRMFVSHNRFFLLILIFEQHLDLKFSNVGKKTQITLKLITV